MAKNKENQVQETGNPSMPREVRSAPELPHEVARHYGLHHLSSTAKPKTPEPTSDTEPQVLPILDNPETEKAVDDIVAKESDDLLDLEVVAPTSEPQPVRRGFWKKAGHFFAAWWRNKWARWITIAIVAAAIGTIATIPNMRYAVLNTVGVRSSASVVVLDNATQLPLKNVTVTLNNRKVPTDINGVAKFAGLKLGPYQLDIRRIAFAPYSQKVNVGWGSNPLGTYNLQAVGTQYTIMVTDYLSGQPLEGAEAESDQGNALSDKAGKIVLTVEDTEVTSLTVKIHASGYRAESAILDAASALTSQQSLVPDQKAVFVSKQSGKYDVYAMDLDGKNVKVLLPGTGTEGDSMGLVTSPDNKQAALISQREGVRDADGYLLYSLTFINIASGVSTVVDRAQQIQPIDWIGTRFIYRTAVAGASAANAQRNRLISYDFGSNARVQLATANQFNLVMSVKGLIYFAASSTDPRATLGLFRIKPDGLARERLSDQEIWTGLRSSYNNLVLQTPNGWYTHVVGSKELVKTSVPASFNTYTFAANQAGDSDLWVDTRDGKGALMMQNTGNGQNVILTSQGGLTYPVRWAGENAIIFRVATSAETADYAISPNGGTPRKLTDVTPTYGFAQVY